mgnify:CR=1 FL=1
MFVVRNFYHMGNSQIGVEIEDKLVVVELESKKFRVVKDDDEIEHLLSHATILAADDKDYRNQSLCAYTDSVYTLMKDPNITFQFCLL